MRITEANTNTVSAVLYTGCSLALALIFFAATLAGDYDWVARLGGAGWIFALAMVILMPTVPGFVRERVTGEKAPPVSHDHEAMMREERKAEMAKDPVCGMDVEPESAAGSSEHDGQTYYFCSVACQEEFDSDPAKFTVEHGDASEDM
jgi:YHS domain-containing protein